MSAYHGPIRVPDPEDCLPLHHRVAVVTGGTRGIGLAVAEGLVERGLRVVVVGSNAEQGARAVERLEAIRRSSPLRDERATVQFLAADLSSIAAIDALSQAIARLHPAIHYLIHNAAVVTPSRSLTSDGIETQWMVNHLAPYLLTQKLMSALDAADAARVVVTASQVERGAQLDLAEKAREEPYVASQVYASTKLANLLFCYALARRLSRRAAARGPRHPSSGLTINALHPGVVRTRLLDDLAGEEKRRNPLRQAIGTLRSGFGRVLRRVGALPPIEDWALSTREGARTTLATALDPGLTGVSGRYFSELHASESSSQSHDESLQEALWQESARSVGISADWPSL